MNRNQIQPAVGKHSCCEPDPRHLVSRRTVLGGLLGGAVLTPVLGLVDAHVSYATTLGWTGDTVVVLSFRGGMDGLSVIVPAGDPAYYSKRPTINVPVASTVQLDSMFGLHPALAPLKDLWDSNQFVPVIAAGLQQPNRSHFDAMAEMEVAAPGTSLRTGWLGRLLGEHHGSDTAFTAVQVSGDGIPTALRPPDAYIGDSAIGIDSIKNFTLDGIDDNDPADPARWGAVLTALHLEETDLVRTSATSTLEALATAASINASYPQAAGDNPNPSYPNSDLGKALADTARMIKSGVGLRVATLDVGDWDMHSGLGSPDAGWMHDKLTDLAAALTAFVADLGPLINRTTLVTMSEFGRRVEENESHGVDHGWGNAMLVVGGNLNGKNVYGTWPGLADDKLTDGDLTATTDYRAVLADILQHRCAAPVEQLQTVFPSYAGLNSLPGITKLDPP